ncbi:hypothetical protein E308F_30850 [Moorella sp. E308F]|uniref:hypothetical protein n=1 Tax=Moorella sp. E308F TaxID=2572682 RepID=UPI0010FFBB78|nr:hypothetical protein [Moorella sp. E308F]GEA16839.1 hypothetical protein E308F_30850 [Moorella sp. E308F]
MDDNRIQVIGKELQEKYFKGTVEAPEIVLTLLAMAKDGYISLEDIRPILNVIFMGNKEGILRALTKASRYVDAKTIDYIRGF